MASSTRTAPELVAPATPRPHLGAAFEAHHGAVFAAAYRVTGNAMDAEDVLQTVFVRLLRRREGPALDPDHAGAYLRRAGVNAALDILRTRGRRGAVPLEEEPAVAEAAPDPADPALRQQVRATLAAMSPRAAEMFALRYFEGYSNTEIGKMLGTSASVVGVTLHRARRRLREDIRSMWEEAR